MKFRLSTSRWYLIITTLAIPIAMKGQNIAIGNVAPVARLHIPGTGSEPSIPGVSSTGILRIGISSVEALDIGKSGLEPFPAWFQAGYNGVVVDPIILQSLGGNVGIGLTNPSAKLEVASGNVRVSGKVTNVTNPTGPQDAATKAYVDQLEVQVAELEGVRDIENNRYSTVTIGSQVWLKENLKVTRYNDGTSIPLVTNPTSWSSLTTHAYTWYNNDASDYGALYNFYVVAESNPKNVCPVGWHVPTFSELYELYLTVGGWADRCREAGLAHWTLSYYESNNISGFTALPGGNRLFDGSFTDIGEYAGFWTQTPQDANSGKYFSLQNSFIFDFDSIDNNSGQSVRCLKD